MNDKARNITNFQRTAQTRERVLELRGVSKSFGTVRAIRHLDFHVNKHEVVGLIGENGAGKSTLLKFLGGVHEPDQGEIIIGGRPVRLRKPSDAVEQGIGLVFQEQSLVTNLTVAENIHNGLPLSERRLGQRFGFYRWSIVNQRASEALQRVGVDIDPKALVGDLTFAQKQMVEVAKAVAVGESTGGTPLVVLDEPTSVLEPAEIQALENEVARLRTLGSVIFVSHRMAEILRVSDRVYVMRDGEVVKETLARDTNEHELVALMTGREAIVDKRGSAPPASSTPRLQIRDLSLSRTYMDISFDVFQGEIVAIAGTHGSGREQLMRTIFGLEKPSHGEILVDSKALKGRPVAAAVRAGIGYVPAERRVEGMVAGTTVADNLCLTHPGPSAMGPLRFPRRRFSIAEGWIERLSVRPPDPSADIARLSGGNQQKIVLAKWLSATNLKLLLLDHPLRGLDPGAREQVMKLIRQACSQGVAVLLLADTIDEALEVGDRVIVMKDGRISGLFNLHEKMAMSHELLERMV